MFIVFYVAKMALNYWLYGQSNGRAQRRAERRDSLGCGTAIFGCIHSAGAAKRPSRSIPEGGGATPALHCVRCSAGERRGQPRPSAACPAKGPAFFAGGSLPGSRCWAAFLGSTDCVYQLIVPRFAHNGRDGQSLRNRARHRSVLPQGCWCGRSDRPKGHRRPAFAASSRPKALSQARAGAQPAPPQSAIRNHSQGHCQIGVPNDKAQRHTSGTASSDHSGMWSFSVTRAIHSAALQPGKPGRSRNAAW